MANALCVRINGTKRTWCMRGVGCVIEHLQELRVDGTEKSPESGSISIRRMRGIDERLIGI